MGGHISKRPSKLNGPRRKPCNHSITSKYFIQITGICQWIKQLLTDNINTPQVIMVECAH